VTKFKVEHPAKPKHPATEGDMDARGLRFGIVVSKFNQFITERLLTSALDCLHRTGAHDHDIHIVRVPGAFEIPAAARWLAESGHVDAIITLGCLLRGETANYEHICAEVTRGVGQSAQETGIPHAWGVLTCDNLEQAIDRAGLKSGNKGFEAAMSAVEMASLGKKLAKEAKGKHHDAHAHDHAHVSHKSEDAAEAERRKAEHEGPRDRRTRARISDLERIAHKHAEKHLKGD
jgi:6,7-dimethyl-8-ribityllumazine synthase